MNRNRWTQPVQDGQQSGKHGHGNAPPCRGAGLWLATRHVLLGTVVTALLAGLSLLRRVEVSGHSMLPTLRPGDRVLAVRCRRARPGQLVVVRDPRSRQRLLVKRLVAMEGDRAAVRGDNTASSTDSSVFGTVRIEARVVYRYAPGDRTGRIH